jgi:TolB protein
MTRSLRIAAATAAGVLLPSLPVLAGDESSSAHASHHERPPEPAGVWFEGETHLANVQQLTFGGQNAEAYWAPDGKRLIFQSTPQDEGCDQIYIMNADGSGKTLVSTGKGRTTCAYFLPPDRILFSSTHDASPDCPPTPDYSEGYVWPLYSTYDIWTAKEDGSDLQRLTDTGHYDAEATVSPAGDWIVFTSTRSGDIEIWKMRPDGSDVTQLTNEPGYDGGPFFSPDGKRICYRASRPAEGKELDDYRRLLAKDLIRPGRLEIYWMNADGTGKTRVTDNGAANFAPYFTTDGTRIVFASNMGDPRGRNFDIFMIGTDGKGLQAVTTCTTFDSFPMFSPDGKRIAFASNRNGSVPGETNIFVADWVD